MTELLWIAVPGGAVDADGQAPLAVLVVPRLQGGGDDLASYGMEAWPELLRRTTFEVAFRDGGIPRSVTPRLGEPASARWDELAVHWQAMFAARARVQPWNEPPQRELHVLDTTAHVKTIRELYRDEIAQAAPNSRASLAVARPVRTPGGEASGPRPDPDFHERVGHLREHPAVLRALGLIIDFDVDVPDGASAVSVIPTLPAWPAGPEPAVVTPWTVCALKPPASSGPRRFLAVPRGGGIVDGLVALGGARTLDPDDGAPDWSITTFDVDHALTRLESLPAAEDDEGGLPGLRSAGLAVIRGGRRAELLDRAGGRGALLDETELHAEDLVLGWRIDVRNPGSAWRSLCERRARYTIGGRPLDERETLVEEGHVKPDAMSVPSGSGGTLEGDEVVARWDGWSLAVPRPNPGRARSRSRCANSPLDWEFSLNDALPRLRFGASYHLRVRIADLAGGGLTVDDLAGDDSDDWQETAPLDYGRVEPIPAPVVTDPVARATALGAGLQRLVIRSAGGPGADPSGADVDVRLLSPPPVSVELADQHGVFDDHAARSDPSWELARRALPSDADAADRTAPPVEGHPVGWLPDPLAARWVLWHADATRRRTSEWARAGADPASRSHPPVRLELVSGTSVAVTERPGQVSVAVPRGRTVELELSSAPPAASGDIEALALHRWVPGESFEQVKADVLSGRQHHITPARTLQFVHAVQRPIVAPVAPLVADRAAHDTFAVLRADGPLEFDAESTAQLDFSATWTEYDEDGAVTGTPAIVASETVSHDADRPWQLPSVRHEFGDTRRRTITCRLTATSRFEEYFDPALRTDDPGAFTTPGPPVLVDVPSSARPPQPVLRHTVPAFAWPDAEPPRGWTQWRWRRRAGLLRVHLGPSWGASGEDERLAVLVTPQDFPPRAVWPYLSAAGRDPIRQTDAPPRWVTADDVLAYGLEPVDVWVPEANAMLRAVAYPPTHDPGIGAGGAWFADVDLGPLAELSYMPFVQLAVGRYQPVSVDRLHLSPIVHTEFVQVPPNRDLSVTRSRDSVVVTLAGRGPQTALNRVIVEVQRFDAAPGSPGAAQPHPELITTSVVPGLPAWTPFGEPASGGLGTALCVPVPATAFASPATRLRLLVREIEELDRPPAPGDVDELLVQRTVYLQTIDLEPWVEPEPPAGGE